MGGKEVAMRMLSTVAFLTLTLGAGAAAANVAEPQTPFERPVTESALASTNAVIAGYSRDFGVMVDTEERSFTHHVGSIAQVTFDNWFAEVGAGMIAANAFADRLRNN
jgi:hypothetical protein